MIRLQFVLAYCLLSVQLEYDVERKLELGLENGSCLVVEMLDTTQACSLRCRYRTKEEPKVEVEIIVWRSINHRSWPGSWELVSGPGAALPHLTPPHLTPPHLTHNHLHRTSFVNDSFPLNSNFEPVCSLLGHRLGCLGNGDVGWRSVPGPVRNRCRRSTTPLNIDFNGGSNMNHSVML